MNCTNCGAPLPPFSFGRCDCSKQPGTSSKKRSRAEYEATNQPSGSNDSAILKKRKRQHSALSVLFIPFDAGGTSRTQKGLSDSGTRGEIFLSEKDSFRRMPFDQAFLEKRDLDLMPPMTPKELVSMSTNSNVTLAFRPEGANPLLSKTVENKVRWDINYDVIACAAVDKLGSEHDRDWEKLLFTHVAVGSRQSRVKCGCTQHLTPPSLVPKVFPELIFLSEELNYNKFPDELTVHDVKYLRMDESALPYNDQGGVKDWKQQIAGYVRSAHRDSEEKQARFSAKRAVTNNNENVLLVTKELAGIKLVACGVHFSSKYVSACKNNDEKARAVLEEKIAWSKLSGADLLIGDFNFDCSFNPQFMPEYASGPQYISVGDRIEQVVSTRASNTSQDTPQRFMNAVVTNDSTQIEPTRLSGIARPVIGDQSLESGYYSDHPWIFVTVSKTRDNPLPEDFLKIPTLPMLTWK
ncbi:hypothetical protein HRD49_24870 [Corallococcus exiguus]|uniref:hypothetical protein n=1 Tax=Corallococcus exiguus TaxID=83462 RepID=UPI00156196BE|nr:hypothetical protein [Corallococcus exiguus]NRD64992.1 hypothetical protein [Corallococcus exiguus]